MRHIFIINPAAGPRGGEIGLEEKIKAAARDEDYEIYYTTGVGDATRFVRELCEKSGDSLRFYACGGDGTLNEVASGAAGFSHAAVACYPCGSGNDFVKSFGGKELFLDLRALMDGRSIPIDLIGVNGRYSINVCNFGLDAAVAETMQRVKNKFIFRGKLAYFAGVIKAFVRNVKTGCGIKVDGEELTDGAILLCTIANGQWVGSAFRCAPRAVLNDGLLEVCVVKPVARTKFVSLMGPYSKGEHLDDPEFEGVLTYRRGRVVTVSSPDAGFLYTLDGELVYEKEFTARAVPGALNFIVPEGAATFALGAVEVFA